MKNTYWIALMMIGSFTHSAQTTPEKFLKNNGIK
jgi:hypothetical protein